MDVVRGRGLRNPRNVWERALHSRVICSSYSQIDASSSVVPMGSCCLVNASSTNLYKIHTHGHKMLPKGNLRVL